jgi:hypothetical protein
MAETFRRRRVSLELPIMPRKLAKGDPRNYRRWHAWIEAVKALAAWCKSQR